MTVVTVSEAVHTHAGAQRQTWAKTIILLGLGVYFTYNIVTGNLTNYINVRFAWLSYMAAALFFVLGVYHAYEAWRGSRHDHAHDHDHDHDHGHDGMSWGALVVVAVPLLLGTLIPSRPLGADAISGSVALTSPSTTINTASLTIPPVERNVLDWLRTFQMVGDYSEVRGEPADVTGFVYREPSFGGDQFMVARFTVSCCVADASAIGVPVAWTQAGELPTDAWVRVQGTFAVTSFRGEQVPVLQAASVETIPQPEHPYLYP